MATPPTTTETSPNEHEVINSASAAASTLFLGQSGESWDFWLIISVVFAALAAAAIGAATAGSIIAHKREALDAETRLERFKLETAGNVSKTGERIASLNNDTARLTAENLALQTVLLPRHVGLIGIDEEPKAKTWFAGFDRWAGTKILIQVVPNDPEAQNLANEIAITLSMFGWKPEFINEIRSGVTLNLVEGLSVFSPASYMAWNPENKEQQEFAKLSGAAMSLARALTSAGLGVGPYVVSGTHGLNIIVDFPPTSEGEASNPFRNFSPRLDGVYLQVGSRPVARTVSWIKQGRPNELGNPAAPTTVPAK